MARGPQNIYIYFIIWFILSTWLEKNLTDFYLFLLLKLAGVLIFSAIPFTAVKAIANSPLGESLQRRMEETKKVSLENSSKFKALSLKARNQR